MSEVWSQLALHGELAWTQGFTGYWPNRGQLDEASFPKKKWQMIRARYRHYSRNRSKLKINLKFHRFVPGSFRILQVKEAWRTRHVWTTSCSVHSPVRQALQAAWRWTTWICLSRCWTRTTLHIAVSCICTFVPVNIFRRSPWKTVWKAETSLNLTDINPLRKTIENQEINRICFFYYL